MTIEYIKSVCETINSSNLLDCFIDVFWSCFSQCKNKNIKEF